MFQTNKLLLYLFLILAASFLNYILQTAIIDENVIIDYLQDQMGYERILEMIDAREKWSWLNYALLPVIYLIKFSIISMWLLCGAILFNFKSSFSEFFKIVVVAEFVWLAPSLLLIVWYGFIDTDYTYTDIQYFAPLSLLSFFNPQHLDTWIIFPLKSLNLFELFYLIVLSMGVMRITKKDFNESLQFALPVYGSSLVVWILFITFLSINLSS